VKGNEIPDWYAAIIGIIFAVFILVKRIVTQVCIRLMSNDICFTGSFSTDDFLMYDRYNNDFNTCAQQLTKISNDSFEDAFVAKYGQDGRLRWTAQTASYNSSIGLNNAMDSNGNVYFTGYYSDNSLNIYQGRPISNFAPPVLANRLYPDNGGDNIFLTKYNDAGVYQWSGSVGPNINTDQTDGYLTSIAYSRDDSLYLATSFVGNNVNLYDENDSIQVYINQQDAEYQNVAAIKYDNTGVPMWVARIDGPPGQLIRNSVSTDASSNLYVSMLYRNTTSGNNFYIYNGDVSSNIVASQGDATAQVQLLYGNACSIIVKFDSEGVYQWTAQLGVPLYWGSIRLSTSADGNLYVSGSLDGNESNIYFYDSIYSGNPNNAYEPIYIYNMSYIGSYRMFVAKYNSDGHTQWVNLIGGYDDQPSNTDYSSYLGSYGIAADSHGNSFTTGYFSDKMIIYDRVLRGNSVDASTLEKTTTLVSHRQPDTSTQQHYVDKNGFVISYDEHGIFRWITQLYNYNTRGYDISVDIKNQPVLGGYFGYYRQSLYITDPIYRFPKNSPPINQRCFVMRHVGSEPTQNHNYDYFIVKFNSVGKVIWGLQMGITSLDDNYPNYALCSIATNQVTDKTDI